MSILQFFPDPGDPTDTTGIAEKATFEPYFDAIAGQSTAIKLLQRAIALAAHAYANATNNLPSAYLFAGIDGVGKRMTARSFIKALFCHSLPTEKADNCLAQIELGNHPDVLWIEPTYIHTDNIIPVSMAVREQLTFKQPPQIRIEQVREIDLEIWGKIAEFAANYTDKGSLIGIQGELKLDEWIDRTTGQQRVKPVMGVNHLELLGSNPNSNSNYDNQAEQTANTAQKDF